MGRAAEAIRSLNDLSCSPCIHDIKYCSSYLFTLINLSLEWSLGQKASGYHHHQRAALSLRSETLAHHYYRPAAASIDADKVGRRTDAPFPADKRFPLTTMSSIKTITPRFTSPTKHEDVDIDLDARSSSCTAHNNNNTMHFHSHDSSVSSLVGGTMTTTPTNTYPSRRSHSLHRASASSAAPLLGGGDNDGDLFSSSDRRRHRRLLSGDSTSSTAPLQGVRRVEAIQAVWTDRSRIVLFIGLALASYVYSLDGKCRPFARFLSSTPCLSTDVHTSFTPIWITPPCPYCIVTGSTTWQFLFYATSTVFGNSYSGSITTSAAIIIAVGKPFMAKMADVFGRAESFVAVAALYSGGYAIIALSSGISGLAGGTLIYSQVLIADIHFKKA